MSTYVVLYKFTEQGIRNIKGSPQRIEQTIKAAEATGAKVLGVWLTMGDYDLVTVVEGGSDESALGMLIAQGAQGNVKSTTLKAFTLEEFRNILSRLPQIG